MFVLHPTTLTAVDAVTGQVLGAAAGSGGIAVRQWTGAS